MYLEARANSGPPIFEAFVNLSRHLKLSKSKEFRFPLSDRLSRSLADFTGRAGATGPGVTFFLVLVFLRASRGYRCWLRGPTGVREQNLSPAIFFARLVTQRVRHTGGGGGGAARFAFRCPPIRAFEKRFAWEELADVEETGRIDG